MKKAKEIESNKINNSLRSSRKKSDEDPIISEIVDYQMSNSTFSTTVQSKKNMNLSTKIKEKSSQRKKNKRVQFNPLITVVNIESYKKENYFGEYKKVGKESDKENSCMLC
jgi:hypothetical protein